MNGIRQEDSKEENSTFFRTSLPRQQGSKLQGNASVVTHCLIMGQGDRGGGEGGGGLLQLVGKCGAVRSRSRPRLKMYDIYK